tara:strand:+ start:1441 stop:2928 length:1488 start_codon:yes stop_codon:yes gene_type:complete
MAKSVFEIKKLQEIYDEIKKLYQTDDRPWILGFSGGKDSTCMAQLVWNAIGQLEQEKRTKEIYIIGCDTLVESPKIVERLRNTLDDMKEEAKEQKLPISTHMVKPDLADTFWVLLLGKGYPAPSSQFRWCTERLKIKNADRFILETVSKFGEAIVLLGTRKDESQSRQQLMELYEIEGSLLNRHSKFAQTYMYCPLKDFLTDDVWNYLLQNKNPWKGNNRDLLAMYQEANAAECPLVVDTSTPSCGNSRFGCWTCTVVARDKAMDGLLEGGEEWLEPLAEIRDELKRTQEPEVKLLVRDHKRRNGKVMFTWGGTEETSSGPYTLEYRKELLEKLLIAQVSVRKNGPDPKMNLILDDEIHEIQRIWRMEQGDWQNSGYQIYKKVTGIELQREDDQGMFGKMEQDLLKEVATNNDVPQVLLSKLIDAEWDAQGMTRHAKVYDKLNSILNQEWRDKEDLEEIKDDLRKRKNEKKKFSLRDELFDAHVKAWKKKKGMKK